MIDCAFCGHPIARTRCKNPMCRKPWQGGGHSFPRKLLREAFVPGGSPKTVDDAEWLAHMARIQAREATLLPADVLDDREQVCAGCGETRWIPAPGIHCILCLATGRHGRPNLKEYRWTPAEDQAIRDRYGRKGPRDIAEDLYRISCVPRSSEAVKIRASRLGLDQRNNQPHLWTRREIGDLLDITTGQVGDAEKKRLITSVGRGKVKLYTQTAVDILSVLYPPVPFERTMRVPEMMRRLGYSEVHALRLCQEGAIRAIQRGGPRGLWYVDESHVEEIERRLRESGATSIRWGRGVLERSRAWCRKYQANRRQAARQTTWMTQSAARRALGISRDDMRDLLEAGVVRGKCENGLWLAERTHVEELAQGGRRALIAAIDAALEEVR